MNIPARQSHKKREVMIVHDSVHVFNNSTKFKLDQKKKDQPPSDSPVFLK